jgi:hypothetical protein
MYKKVIYLCFASFFIMITSWFLSGCHIHDYDPYNDSRNYDHDGSYHVDNNNYIAKEDITYKFPVNSRSRIRLNGINGSMTVIGRSGSDSIIILCEKLCSSESVRDAQNHLSDLIINFQDVSTELYTKTIQPSESYGRGYTVNYIVYIPDNFEVYLDLVNGAIQINNINNYISINNTNGNALINNCSGNTYINLINGLIDCRQSMPLNGRITLYTINGNINLGIPSGTSSDVSVSTISGSINYYNLNFINLNSTLSSLQGRLGNGQGKIILSTINGRINLTGY